MYYDEEIKGGKKFWTVWLRSFTKGESRVADAKDRSKIMTSISNNFHKNKIAKFSTAVDPKDPFKLNVTREW